MNERENTRDGTKEANRGIKTSRTVFAIIESIQELDGATVPELAEHVGLARSTVHNHVKTLLNQGYLTEEDGEYSLGLKFLEYGYTAKSGLRMAELGEPALSDLADETDEIAWIVVEEHGEAVYISGAEGENALHTRLDHVGLRTSLHFTASGKAILAHLPRERVEEIIEESGLPSATNHTITDREELFEELDRIRERGIAFADGEAVEGVRSVAVPIKPNDEVLGSITVYGPKHRLTDDRFRETIPEKLLGAANAIELEYTYS